MGWDFTIRRYLFRTPVTGCIVGYGQQMDRFDGRALGVGIAVGVVLGLVVCFFTGNPMWVTIGAAVGAILGVNAGWLQDGDKDNSNDDTDSPSNKPRQ